MLPTRTCRGTIPWSTGNLLGAIHWKNIDSPFSNSHQSPIAPQLGVGSWEPLSNPCSNSFAWMNSSNTVSMLSFYVEVFSSLGLQRSKIAVECDLTKKTKQNKCDTCCKYLHQFYIHTCDVLASWRFVRPHLTENKPGVERWLHSQEDILLFYRTWLGSQDWN